jgi:hypothetical protein
VLPIERLRAGVAGALLLGVAFASACAASDPPPTSPLEDTGVATATSVGALPTFPAGATASPTPAPSEASATPVSSAAADAERITGDAIARLAEWIGAAETEFRLTSIEAVEWPDACLGVEIPTVACADVITPGYRVTLHHVAAPNSLYLVHTSDAGRYVWAPSRGPEQRTVASVDPDAGTVTLERIGGEDHMGTLQRTVPGSTLEVPLRELSAGQRVTIGTADPLEGGDAGLIVLLAPERPR